MHFSAYLLFSASRSGGGENVPQVDQVSGATMNVSWADRSEAESGFRIYIRPSQGGNYALVKTLGQNIQSTTLTGLAYGTSYDVKIASYNDAGEYSQVGPVTRYTPPQNAPTSLASGAITADSITVAFAGTSPQSSGYRTRYKLSANSTWLEGPTVFASPVTFSGLNSETSYDFQIRAYFMNPSPQADSLGPWSGSLIVATAVEPVTSVYVDAIRALSLPPMIHWPLISNSTASNPSNPSLAAYFQGVASDVSYGHKSVIYGAGRSTLFGPNSEIEIPNGWEIEDICALVAWVEFLTVPTGYVRIIDQIAGWGIVADGGKFRGFVNGSGYFGGEAFSIEANTKYCVAAIRKSTGAWTLYVNGVEGGFSRNETPTALTTSKIGSSANHSSTSFRMHHASLHYNGSVAPDSAWAAAIYAARS